MFRTELTIVPATGQLPRTARVLTMGSCFADSIGSRLAANKVETLVNPFGTVFQPLALGRLLRAAAGEDVDWQQHLVEARGRWQSYDLHGSVGADSPVELLQIIQELVWRTGEFLRQADLVLLTLGTAWAYRLRETGELVSNCHKQSADLFVQELLTPDEIINNLAETHAYLRRINPELRFVLTVSPVRHLKDTLPLNAVSKSVLRLATHIVSDLLPGVAYFPASELLLDDLRDYRFYASDMLHPSEVAEDYIWEKFARTYFDADFGRFRKEWAAVRQSLGHRPLHAGAPEHRQFLESTREKLEQLSLRKVEVATELNEVRTQLAALPVPRQPQPVMIPEDDEERIDIGEGAAEGVTPIAAQLEATTVDSTEGRPPRLSPEEFRAQRATRSGRPERGRRDGRGKGQRDGATENEQFQTAAGFSEEQPGMVDATGPATPQLAANVEQAEPLVTLAEAPTLPGEEPEKKKKRRSRGGAKRTARKNALRLSAGELLPETDASASLTESAGSTGDDENIHTPSDRPKSSVITKSVPVKRGGRRNEPGRVPRVELFAAATEAPASAEASLQLPVSVALPVTAAELPVPAPGLGSMPVAEMAAALENPRNGHNRNNRGPARTDDRSLPTASAEVASAVVGATQNAPTERPALLSSPNEPAESAGQVAPAKANKSNRAKRMVSAARSEKPAIDVPVIPITDVRQRTQVAAGRMMGTSASLIAPTTPSAPAQNVAAAKAPVAARKVVVTKVPAAKPVAKAALAPIAPVVVASPVPAAKPKAAPKPKVAPLKATVAPATVSKAVVAKPAAAPTKPAPTVAAPAPAKPTRAAVAKPEPKKSAANPKVKVSAAKPVVTTTVATKPLAAKPAAAKPAVVKPLAAKPVAVKAAVAKAPAKPAVAKPTGPKPAAAKPLKPSAAKPIVPKAKAPKKPAKPA